MAKQKVVLKVAMGDAKKRSKALKTAVRFVGVVSVTLDKDNDLLTVVGDGVDSVKLALFLRCKMGSAELVSVGSAEEKKEEKKYPAVEWPNKWVCHPETPTSSIYWTYPAAPLPYECASYHYVADHEKICSIL